MKIVVKIDFSKQTKNVLLLHGFVLGLLWVDVAGFFEKFLQSSLFPIQTAATFPQLVCIGQELCTWDGPNVPIGANLT